MKKKTIITVSGIRPDFIRMSKIFKIFDKKFNHILVHTGQHYDEMLSEIFFNDLKIRKPDYNLNISSYKSKHYHQLSNLNIKFIDLLKKRYKIKILKNKLYVLNMENNISSLKTEEQQSFFKKIQKENL